MELVSVSDLYTGFESVSSDFGSRSSKRYGSDGFLTPLSTGTRRATGDEWLDKSEAGRLSSADWGDGTDSARKKTISFSSVSSPVTSVQECVTVQLQRVQTQMAQLTAEKNDCIFAGQYQAGIDLSKRIKQLAADCLAVPGLTDTLTQTTVKPLLFKAWLNHAEVHVMAGKFKQAERLFTNIFRQEWLADLDDSYQRTVNTRLAQLHQRQGNYEKALQIWLSLFDDSAIAPGPDRSNIVDHIARCYAAEERFDLAFKYNEINAETGTDHSAAFIRLVYLLKRGEEFEQLRAAFYFMLLIEQCHRCAINGTTLKYFDQASNTKVNACRNCIRDAASLLVHHAPENELEVLDWCAEALIKTPWKDVVVDLDLFQCGKLLEEGRIDQAIELLEDGDYDEMDAGSQSRVHACLSWIYLQMDNAERCLEHANKAHQITPDSPSAQLNMACAYQLSGEYDKALNICERLTSADPTHYSSAITKGMVLKSLGRHEEALRTFSTVPDICLTPQLKFAIAELQEMTERPQKAFETLTALSQSNPDDCVLLLKLAALSTTLNDLDTSVWYYNKVLQLDPTNLKALDALGKFSITKQLPEKAVGYYELAAKAEPSNAEWKVLHAAATRRAGRALDAFDLCLEIHYEHPDDISCLHLLLNIGKQMRIPEDQMTSLRVQLDELIKRQNESGESKRRASTVNSSSSDSLKPSSLSGTACTGYGKTHGGDKRLLVQPTGRAKFTSSCKDPALPGIRNDLPRTRGNDDDNEEDLIEQKLLPLLQYRRRITDSVAASHRGGLI